MIQIVTKRHVFFTIHGYPLTAHALTLLWPAKSRDIEHIISLPRTKTSVEEARVTDVMDSKLGLISCCILPAAILLGMYTYNGLDVGLGPFVADAFTSVN